MHMPKGRTARAASRSTKGASATEYTVLLALLSLLALGVLYAMGGSLSDSFETADQRLASAQDQGRGAGGGTLPTTPVASEEPLGCYEDTSGDFTHTFPSSDPHTCFNLHAGNDTVAFESTKDLTITGTDGWKVLTVGPGDDLLDLSYTAPLDTPQMSHDVSVPLPINTGDGADVVRMTRPYHLGVATGLGDDTIELLDLPPIQGYTQRIVRPGLGQNTVITQCSDTPVIETSISVQGQDDILSNGCKNRIHAVPAPAGQALPVTNVVLQNAHQTYALPSPAYSALDGRWGSLDITGTGLLTSYIAYLFPATSGLDNATRHVRTNTSGPRVSGTIDSQASNPTEVALRHHFQEGATSALGNFSLRNPPSAWTVDTTSAITPTPQTVLRMFYNTSRPDVGVPQMAIGNVDAYFYLEADLAGRACWIVTLSDPSSGASVSAPCNASPSVAGSRRHTFTNLDSAQWRRLTLTNPTTGQQLVFNINGTAPLQIASLTIYHTRDSQWNW